MDEGSSVGAIVHRLHNDAKFRETAKRLLEVAAKDTPDLMDYLPDAAAVIEYCAHRDGTEAIRKRLMGPGDYAGAPRMFAIDYATNFLIQTLFERLEKTQRPQAFLEAVAGPQARRPERAAAAFQAGKSGWEPGEASGESGAGAGVGGTAVETRGSVKPAPDTADLEARLAEIRMPVMIRGSLGEMREEDKDRLIVRAILKLNREKLLKFVLLLRYCETEKKIEELADKLGLTGKTIYKYTDPLYKRGLIEKGSRRGFYITVKRRFPLNKSDEEGMLHLAFAMPDVFLGGVF